MHQSIRILVCVRLCETLISRCQRTEARKLLDVSVPCQWTGGCGSLYSFLYTPQNSEIGLSFVFAIWNAWNQQISSETLIEKGTYASDREKVRKPKF